MTKVIEVTSREDIELFVKNNEKVIVDFAAESWCVPCRALKPHYEAASEKATDTIWLHADVDLYQNLVDEFNVSGVPMLYAYKNGEFVEQVDPSIRTAITLVNYSASL